MLLFIHSRVKTGGYKSLRRGQQSRKRRRPYGRHQRSDKMPRLQGVAHQRMLLHGQYLQLVRSLLLVKEQKIEKKTCPRRLAGQQAFQELYAASSSSESDIDWGRTDYYYLIMDIVQCSAHTGRWWSAQPLLTTTQASFSPLSEHNKCS